MKHPTSTVFKALSLGMSVKLPGFEHPLHLAEGNGLCYFLDCFEILDDKWIPKEKKIMGWDPPLSWFVSECEKISPEDLFILSSEIALTEINRSKSVF